MIPFEKLCDLETLWQYMQENHSHEDTKTLSNTKKVSIPNSPCIAHKKNGLRVITIL
jgi:hypothetical protein